MEKRFIYADNAATTAVSEKVLQAMRRISAQHSETLQAYINSDAMLSVT